MAGITSKIVKLAPREKQQTIELLALTTAAALAAAGPAGALPYKTDWLEIAAYPTSALHLYGDTMVGLSADVEISNVAHETAGEKVATALSANKVVALTQGACYVRVVVTAMTSGKFAVQWNGALQS